MGFAWLNPSSVKLRWFPSLPRERERAVGREGRSEARPGWGSFLAPPPDTPFAFAAYRCTTASQAFKHPRMTLLVNAVDLICASVQSLAKKYFAF